MLFQIGLLTADVRPFNVDEWARETTGEWAKKDLLGRRPAYEFTGEGEGKLSFKGKVHPTKVPGGLSMLELGHAMARSGSPQFVTRGDGAVLGWFAVKRFSESHSNIGPELPGVGREVEHEIELVPVEAPGADIGAGLLSGLISLFG